jgi:hypothetical protein
MFMLLYSKVKDTETQRIGSQFVGLSLSLLSLVLCVNYSFNI